LRINYQNPKFMKLRSISVILLLFLTLSCSKKSVPASEVKNEATEQKIAERDYEKEKFVRATVVDMTGLDGCQFLLKLEGGKKLEPLNLDPAYKKDGLPVWIRYIASKGSVSICMAGKMVKLIAIEKRAVNE